MAKETIKTTKELRKFGLVMVVPLAIIGGVLLWKGKFLAPYVLILSALFLIFGLFFPKLLAPVEKIWMKFAEILSVIMTRVILSLTFYLVITPLGLLVRLLGKDLLQKKFEQEVKTYWVPVDSNGPCSRPDKPY